MSDISLKENIMDVRSYLSDLRKLRVVKFSLKREKLDHPNQLGLIAQEVEQVFPSIVTLDRKENVKSVGYSVINLMMLKSIQEMAETDEKLENKILNLENKIVDLNNKITNLETENNINKEKLNNLLLWAKSQGMN